MKKDSKKDSAVSPVIGTILLVAITVVLVAIISAVVMGMTGNVGQTYVVGVKVANDNGHSIVTFTGGQDISKMTGWTITNGTSSNTTYVSTKPVVGTPYVLTENILGETSVVGMFPTGNQTVWSGKLL